MRWENFTGWTHMDVFIDDESCGASCGTQTMHLTDCWIVRHKHTWLLPGWDVLCWICNFPGTLWTVSSRSQNGVCADAAAFVNICHLMTAGRSMWQSCISDQSYGRGRPHLPIPVTSMHQAAFSSAESSSSVAQSLLILSISLSLVGYFLSPWPTLWLLHHHSGLAQQLIFRTCKMAQTVVSIIQHLLNPFLERSHSQSGLFSTYRLILLLHNGCLCIVN